MLLHPGKEGGPVHTDVCKKRLIDALKTTPEGRSRVQQTELRQNTRMAKDIERDHPFEKYAKEREEKLDQNEPGNAQLRHEAEADEDEHDDEQPYDGEKLYDMFAGYVSDSKNGEEELRAQCDTDGKETNDEDDECRQAAR